MRTPVPLASQLAAVTDDPVRVLIIGAGIAGTTLAALLRRQGLHPVVIERAAADTSEDIDRHLARGYNLGLMPLVDRTIARLGGTDAYLAASVGLHRYRLYGRAGQRLKDYSFDPLLARFGHYRGIERARLIDIVSAGEVPTSFDMTLSSLRQDADVVRVGFASTARAMGPGHDAAAVGTAAAGERGGTGPGPETARPGTEAAAPGNTHGAGPADFDLVVGADGLHSGTRRYVLDPEQVTQYDTGWGGWLVWTERDPSSDRGLGTDLGSAPGTPAPGSAPGGAPCGAPDGAGHRVAGPDPASATDRASVTDRGEDLVTETWGRGFFIGTYPVPGRTAAFVGGPRTDTSSGPADFAQLVHARLRHMPEATTAALDALARSPDPYYWSLVDVRAARWSSGRVVLLGDAAAGFLPTAGIGAAMALESAGALAEHLVIPGPDAVPDALAAYEATQRPRAEVAQDASRSLARLMFQHGRLPAAARDLATRFTTMRMALGSIERLHRTQPAGA